jgi:hypothetical protein
LNSPTGIAISGNIIYVVNFGGGTVGEYNATTGSAINVSFITGLGVSVPSGIAVSGSSLYVTNTSSGTIGEYNSITGAPINTALITGLNFPFAIALSGNNLYVTNNATGTVGVYNATTGAVINAALVAGTGSAKGIAISGSNLYVVNDAAGTVSEYNATTGAIVNSALLTGLSVPSGIAVIGDGSDVGAFNAQKSINYVQTSFTTPTLNPDGPYQFQVSVNGAGNDVLTTSTLVPPAASTGSATFQNGLDGLNFQAQFQTQAAMDAAFADGTYALTIQTSTPNTYPDTFSLTGDSYPSIPTLVSVTNGTNTPTWVNGHLNVDYTQDIVFTWTPYVSATGSVSFNLNNGAAGTVGPAIATNNSYTIPAGSLSNNTAYKANLNFANLIPSSDDFGISGGAEYETQNQFLIYTGTPPSAGNTVNVVIKRHVLTQSSTSAPVNGSGYINNVAPAPYDMYVQDAAAGSVTGPGGGLTLAFNSRDDTSSNDNAPYEYQSAAIASQTTLDSTYPNGNYTFPDSRVLSLTGNTYPNTPQITQVNGATPIEQ